MFKGPKKRVSQSDTKGGIQLFILSMSSFLAIARFYHWGMYGFAILFLYSLYETPRREVPSWNQQRWLWVFILYCLGRSLVDQTLVLGNYYGLLTPLVLGCLAQNLHLPISLPEKKKQALWIGFQICIVVTLIPNLIFYQKTMNALFLKNSLCLATAGTILCWQGVKSLGILGFILGISFLGGARTNGIALVLALCIMGIGRLTPRRTGTFLMIVLTGYVLVVWVGVDVIIHNPLSQALAERLRSFQERTVVWRMVTDLYTQNPWWGIGPYSVSQVLKNTFFYTYGGVIWDAFIRHPHNVIFEIKACLGSVGLWLLWAASMEKIRALRSREDSAIMLAIGVYMVTMLSGYLSFFRDSWFLGGIGLACFWKDIFSSSQQMGASLKKCFGKNENGILEEREACTPSRGRADSYEE